MAAVDTPQAAPTDRARQVHRELAEATGVALPVRLWDGSELGPEAEYRIVLEHPEALRALLLPPSDLSAGEAYVVGHVDVEGDLVAAMAELEGLAERRPPARRLVRLLGHLLAHPRPTSDARQRRARLRGRRRNKRRDREAIAFHYDHPQALYDAFLDDELVYSCAYFDDPDGSLEAAQRRKLDLVCRKLRLGPGSRLLDIGCGYGSLLAHAAERYGATGVGVTLSERQVEIGQRRLADRGLDGVAEVRLQDYRDVEGSFDAVCSIGMIEHVGPQQLGPYHERVEGLLRPGGLALTHGIVTGDADWVRRGSERTFISKHVFPDGGLVPAWRVVRDAERAGLDLLDVEQLRPHYALTLRAWVRRLEERHDEVVAAVGERTFRTWRAYMAGSAAAFEAGRIGVVQVLLGKGADVPLGRAWMLPRA